MRILRTSLTPGWLLYWVLTFVLAFGVIGVLPLVSSLALSKWFGGGFYSQLALLAANGLVQGTVLGLLQWLLLRRLAALSPRYILFTALGWTLGLAAGLFITRPLSGLVPDPGTAQTQISILGINILLALFNGLPFFLAGVILGLFQWRELRHVLKDNRRWVLGLGIGFLLYLVVQNIGVLLTQEVFFGLLVFWIASLAPGIFSGSLLLLEMREERLLQFLWSGGPVLSGFLILLSFGLVFLASEIDRSIQLAWATKPDFIEIAFDGELTADGETEISLFMVVRNRFGEPLSGENLKIEISNMDVHLQGEAGEDIIVPMDEGCIVLEEEVCLPSVVLSSGPSGIAEVKYRVPMWEPFLETTPVTIEAWVFESDPDLQKRALSTGELFFRKP